MIQTTAHSQPGFGSRLSTWIADNPCQTFVTFCLVHIAVWTAAPALVYPNLPLDLIEALIYGREWQLGHDKLPPLPWWMVEIAYRTIGRDFAYYLMAQLVVVTCFAFVFIAALPIVGPAGALVSVLIIDGFHYFNITAAKFNHDVIQLPFWALAGLSFLRALQGGRLHWWALLGGAIGGALWSKYFVVILVAPLALYIVLDAKARRTLLTPGPYVAAIVALIVMAPHLIWLAQNDFLPFAYAEARSVPSRGWLDHLRHPTLFLAAQAGASIPALFIASPLFRAGTGQTWTGQFNLDFGNETFRIVTTVALGPLAVLLLLSFVTGRGVLAMWGFPLFCFLGLWVVMVAKAELDRARLSLIVAGWAIIASIFVVGFIVNNAVLTRFHNRFNAQLYPGQVIADRMIGEFERQTGEKLHYVIGRIWPAGNISHYAREGRPRVLIDGNPKRAPWIDIADLKKHGALIVWIDFDRKTLPTYLREIGKDALVQTPLELPWIWPRKGTVEQGHGIGWAILKPQK